MMKVKEWGDANLLFSFMITHCLDMIDLFNYQRRKSSVAKIGNLLIGGENPIRVQSMTTTDTMILKRVLNRLNVLFRKVGNWFV